MPVFNEYIKGTDVNLEYTAEMIKELARCSKNLWEFLKYIKIIELDRGRQSFRPYKFQKKMFKQFMENRHNICLCSRQSGKTTVCGIYALWFAIFNKDKFIAIASNKGASAKDVLSRIKQMYEELPNWLKPGVKEYNKFSVEFENGSKIVVGATSKDTFRGRSINLLILDEFAFVSPGMASDFWMANYPALAASDQSKILIISTPNGIGNIFYNLYTDAERGKNSFKPMKVTWRDVPGRDEAWAKEQIANIGKTRFSQEFNVDFVGSTNTVVSTDRLEYLLTQVSSPISTELQNRFRIFEFPQENQQYIIGVDVAKGTGEHSSCIQILKLKSMKPLKLKQVAAFEDNYTDIYMFAEIINRIGTYYNKAFVVLENNAEGAGVVNRLWWDYGYENLVNEGEKSTKLGVRATRATKPKAVLLMKKLIEDLCLELPDESTVNQLISFIDDGKGHFRGNDGAPDDLISALYWACYTMEFDLFESKATVIVEADGVPEEVWGILVGFDSPTGDDNWL